MLARLSFVSVSTSLAKARVALEFRLDNILVQTLKIKAKIPKVKTSGYWIELK